jgi:hypothetical protein
MEEKMTVKDERRLHLYYLSKLIGKYSRILVYGPWGEGKTYLFKDLKLKFPDVNFYSFGENEVSEPYVYAITEINPDYFIPDFDIIYCMQYSTEYKEGRTGYSFNDKEWHPMAEYVEKQNYIQIGQKNLSGKTFKSIDKLVKAIKE